MRPRTTSGTGAAQTRPRRGLGWRSPLKIRLFRPLTTLRRLHSVPDGRKLNHGRAASGKCRFMPSARDGGASGHLEKPAGARANPLIYRRRCSRQTGFFEVSKRSGRAGFWQGRYDNMALSRVSQMEWRSVGTAHGFQRKDQALTVDQVAES